jgi:hypothetical protein
MSLILILDQHIQSYVKSKKAIIESEEEDNLRKEVSMLIPSKNLSLLWIKNCDYFWMRRILPIFPPKIGIQ